MSFWADMPHHKGLKIRIYQQKLKQKRKKEGDNSEVTKQKFLLSNPQDKTNEIGGLHNLSHSLSFSSVL